MLIQERSYSSPAYRYGFNGMEKDDEVKGEGNSYDFGARMLNPRVGRWFKTDPILQKYPYDSPYMFSGNSPISIMDPDGERKKKVTKIFNLQGELIGEKISIVDYSFIKKTVYSECSFSGDAQISYDYYDSIDLEFQVQDNNGMILSAEIVERDILGEKRIDKAHPLFADLHSNALALEDEYNLMGDGDTWGAGGVDFYSTKGEGSGIIAKDRSKVDYTNGDDLIAFLSTGGGLGRPGRKNTTPHPDRVAPDSKVLKIFKKLKDQVSKGKKTNKYIEEGVKTFRKICNQCNKMLEEHEKESHPTLGLGTRDTIISNEKKVNDEN